MRQKRSNSILAGASPDLFDAVAKRFPEYVEQGYVGNILLRRQVGHPDIDEFVEFCRSIGATIARDRSQERADVVIIDGPSWSPGEIDQSPLVRGWIKGPEVLEAQRVLDGFDAKWTIKADQRLKQKANQRREIGCIWAHGDHVLVRGSLRQKFEQSGLKHLVFVPLDVDSGAWPQGVEPWWLLWSDLELPPVENLLFDNDGRVWKSNEDRGPFPNGCWPLDGYEGQPRLTYDHSLLDLDAFDVAVTYERFGNREPCLRQPIFSQRFRAFCHTAKLRFEWFPVKLTGATI